MYEKAAGRAFVRHGEDGKVRPGSFHKGILLRFRDREGECTTQPPQEQGKRPVATRKQISKPVNPMEGKEDVY